MNTKIEYFYRDEFNNKTFYEAILEGAMTDEQEAEILNCIDEEGTFIPSFSASVATSIATGAATAPPTCLRRTL